MTASQNLTGSQPYLWRSPGAPGFEVAERALNLAAGTSPDPAGGLVTMTEGRRRPLEGARHVLSDRLHHRSDDFAATRALRLVSAALSRIGWEAPFVRGRDPRRRLSSVLWPWSGRQELAPVNHAVAVS